jgi:hypothetical protein
MRGCDRRADWERQTLPGRLSGTPSSASRGGGNERTGIRVTDAYVSVCRLGAKKASGFALRQMLRARLTPNRLTRPTSVSEYWLTGSRLSRLSRVCCLVMDASVMWLPSARWQRPIDASVAFEHGAGRTGPRLSVR